MPTLAPIRVVISGVDKVSNKMAKIQKRINKVSAKMTKAGSKMSAGITAPVMLAGAAIFRAGYQFDKFMNTVEAKSTVVGASIGDLRKKAIELGSSTSYSHIQAAEAMGFLAQAGYNTGQTFKAIQPVMSLAQATNIGLGESADWLSNIMGGMGWQAERSAEAAAILATTTAKANVSMEDLSYTFADAGPVAKMYGASLRDVAATAGFLGNVGIKGTKAATAMKTMFLNISSQTPAATKALDKMGIVVTNSQGKMRDFKDILGDMAKVLPKMKQKDAIDAMATIFGKKSIAGVAALTENLKKSNGKFLELVGTINQADATGLQKMVDTMRKGSVGAWDDTVSALQGLGQAIADSGLMDFISNVLRGITKLFRYIADKSPGVLKAGTVFAAIAAAIGPLLVALGALLPMITSVASSIAGAGGVMALVSNPIGWVVAAIIALVAATVLLWDHIKPLRDMIGNNLAKAFIIIQPLIVAVKGLFMALWNNAVLIVDALMPLAGIFGDLFGGGSLTGLQFFVKILTFVVDLVTKAVQGFGKLIGLVARLVQGFANLASKITGPVASVFTSAQSGINTAGDWLGSTMDSVGDKLGIGGGATPKALGQAAAAASVKAQSGESLVTLDFKNVPAGVTTNVTGKGAKINTDNGQILAAGL